MNIQKITPFRKQLLLWLFFIQAAAFAQTGTTIQSFTPNSRVTYRTVITVTTTNAAFPGNATGAAYPAPFGADKVRFYKGAAYTNSLKAVALSANKLQITVPAITGTNTGESVVYFRIIATTNINSNVISSNFTFVSPNATVAANSKVTRMISTWNGYWSSTATSSNTNDRPDQHHSLTGFQYGGVLYSTGSESAVTNSLTVGGLTAGDGVAANTYLPANFRALPVSTLEGTISANDQLIVLGSKVDNNPNGGTVTAPDVAGLKVRDVLIDGIRGLDLGTGVTNLPAESVMTFQATSIVGDGIDDNVPDIMVTQVAAPGSTDIYSFIDATGNVVGTPIQVTFDQIPAIGTYKTDFFTLPMGSAINSAVVQAYTTSFSPSYRDYRIVAYKLSEFGINATNKDLAAKFKVMPSGSSDPAFLAYNRASFQVPAPEITGEPTSQVACLGSSTTFAVSVNAVGTENTFQWKRNGIDLVNGTFNGVTISGATSTSLTISPITSAYVGTYTCVVTNTSNGSVAITSPAYLNTAITSVSPYTTACINTTDKFISVGAQGADLKYQWYTTTNITTETGDTNGNGISGEIIPTPNATHTLIPGATSASYYPSTAALGQKYYFVKVWNNGSAIIDGEPCTSVTSSIVYFTVGAGANAGNPVAAPAPACIGSTSVLSLSGQQGNIQWQQSTSGEDNTFVNVTGGTGATSANYTTAALTQTTYYRAVITSANGSCTEYSNVVTISVISANSWVGSASNNLWNTPSNWSCGIVPTIESDVTIPTGRPSYPHIAAGVTGLAKTLTVDAATSGFTPAVTVEANGTLEVATNLTVAATASVVVNNNASLVQHDGAVNTGAVTVKRNSNPLFRLDYTMWSSPVDNQVIGTFSPFTSTSRFYTFDGPTNSYIQVPNLTASFQTATGYLIRMPNSITGGPTGPYYLGTATHIFEGKFTGKPHTGTYTKALNAIGTAYTATGNPYPSPISVKKFFNDNGIVLGNSGSTGALAAGSGLYLWRKKNDHTVSTYATLTLAGLTANSATPENPNDPTNAEYSNTGGQAWLDTYTGDNAAWTIAPAQGFIVKANTSFATPQLQFNNAMRVAAAPSGTNPFFKGATANNDSRLWLNLSSEGGFSQLLLAYIDGATTGIDAGYDGFKLNETANGASIYTTVEDNDLVIEARPAFDPTDEVTVNYTASAAGQYTFKLDHTDGVFENDQNVFLVDNFTGATTNISEAPYSFTSEAGVFANRFKIIYMQPLSTENPALTANSVVVYQQGGVINIASGNIEMTDVTIYDIRGRKLLTKTDINATETSIANLAAQQQVLIVEINTLSGKVTKKIVF
ncbi:T9SS sorting signal type C domain-containing protein [Flavobacterium subsaxonicum]|uniref:Ig-like domain-containing protein n=1 Tax=Flavobacterium subsaxonicum WB 4.1-42 = DSM 21790 TaxID=1121898 RepID=A0A0A2MTR1_9FLAO|nr:T9SS sorting signal type C domain-containing protein [Flavobacterium subsaxonicum]KGO91615.1 hypothetical protein Q766_17280 [Flavobacterium subsaxonicum WB 4.1-42 = DSM 21790]